MKQNESHKHHYLPRKYLKGFTNTEGTFFVYDKKADKIFSSKPDIFFFENDLNTVTFPKGNTSDNLEKMYTHMENLCWEYIDRIRNTQSKDQVNFLDKEFLFFYLLFQYWRLPSNIPLVESLSETAFTDNSAIDYFSLKNRDGSNASEEISKVIRDSTAFKKYVRLMLPFAPFVKDKDRWGKRLLDWRFLYTQNNTSFFLVGDKPIITSGSSDTDPVHMLDEFVFPVSGRLLLINHEKPMSTGMEGDFLLQYNLSVIHKSERFTICHDEKLLIALVDCYKQQVKFGKSHLIIKQMFDMLKAQ